MTIRNMMILCSLLAIAGVAQAADKHLPKSKLTAEQIIARNVRARGGEQAWSTVKTLTLSGKLEAGGKKNTELAFIMRLKRPHKSRLEIEFNNQKAIQVYDGVHGWKVRPFLGRNDAEPFTPAERRAAADWQELDGTLIDHVRKGIKVIVEGMDKVEKHKAYKLKLTMKDGEVRHLWIDARTFLELRIDGQPRKMDGKLRQVSVYYRDYRKEHGLTVPRVFETAVDGVKQTYKMHIERVVVNNKMDDTLFEKPLQVASRPPG